MSFKYTSASTAPVTLTEVKNQLNLTTSDKDTLLTFYISAATDYVEEYLNRPLVLRTVEEVFDEFNDNMRLSRAKPTVISEITYVDTDGVEQTLADTVYELDNWETLGRIKLKFEQAWPSTDSTISAVKVSYSAGWADVASVPDDIKLAMLLMITKMFWCREDSVKALPTASEHLLRKYKITGWRRVDVNI